MAPNDSPPELSPDRIRELAAELGLVLDHEQSAALTGYARLLQRWNRVHNLTARDSTEDLLSHHLLDSLAVVPWITGAAAGEPAPAPRVLDVGAGPDQHAGKPRPQDADDGGGVRDRERDLDDPQAGGRQHLGDFAPGAAACECINRLIAGLLGPAAETLQEQ